MKSAHPAEGTPSPSSHPAPPYPPIGDYALIADCHATALVSRSGSIDWCCLPRIDSASCFGRLLDWNNGGFCSISPNIDFNSTRRYLEDTLVLETRFTTASGTARLLDLMPLSNDRQHVPHGQVLRIIEGLEGETPLSLQVQPRFEYGEVLPWIRRYPHGGYIALAGCDGLLISSDIPLKQIDRHRLAGQVTVAAGQRFRFSMIYRPSRVLDDQELFPPDSRELERRLEQTVQFWRDWSAGLKIQGAHAAEVRRSALILKGLSNRGSGAIAAAATTSLPEAPGGIRNWDYRFTWIRDSVFSVRSLGQIGCVQEADHFRRFIERSAAGSAAELQIMFGVEGERRLEEYRLDSLEGYRGSRPVRIGNAAHHQLQLDIYGELLDLAWRWHLGGQSPDDDYWEFLGELVQEVARSWDCRDHGIWEVRNQPRHFVFSKVMCWSAVDKGIMLAEELGRKAPLEQWRALRERIRRVIERRGFDRGRGVFVQAFGHQQLDAALLRMPMTGFIAYDDPRMVATVAAIRRELELNGLVRRYSPGSDGFKEDEGVFLACSFWLAECLARQGQTEQAGQVFQAALNTGNDLGLFAEQADQLNGELLGNFPQALTHLSLISAALALDGC